MKKREEGLLVQGRDGRREERRRIVDVIKEARGRDSIQRLYKVESVKKNILQVLMPKYIYYMQELLPKVLTIAFPTYYLGYNNVVS